MLTILYSNPDTESAMNPHARIDDVSCETLLTVALDGVDRVAEDTDCAGDVDFVAAAAA